MNFPPSVVALLREYTTRPTTEPDPGKVCVPLIVWNNCCPLGRLPAMENDPTPNQQDISDLYTPVTGITFAEFHDFCTEWDMHVTYDNWREAVAQIWGNPE